MTVRINTGAGVKLGTPGAYTAQALTNNGTSFSLYKSANLTGITDSAIGCLSFWFNFTGGDGVNQWIVYAHNFSFYVSKNASNQIGIFMKDTPTGTICNATTTNTFTTTVNTGWHHFYLSWDYSGAGEISVSIDNTPETLSYVTNPTAGAGSAMEFSTLSTAWGITNNSGQGGRVTGDIADIVLHDKGTIPITEFIDSDGKPKSIEKFTGAAMNIRGPASTQVTNYGTGGNFTAGTLADATTSPSD